MSDKQKVQKKILYLITKSNWGGAQRYVFDLAKEARALGHEVIVAAGGTGELGANTGRQANELEQRGIRFIRVPYFARNIYFFYEWLVLWYLYKLFRKEKLDVVHLNSSKAGGIGAVAAWFAKVPNVIFTVHGLAHEEDRSFFIRGYLKFLTWLTFLFSSHIIAITKDNFHKISKMPFTSDKLSLIHNGLKQTQLLSKDEARVKIELDGDFWIGTIGELTKNKGYEYTLRALAKLGNKDWIFVAIGEGEEHTRLEELAGELGINEQVYFPGFIENASSLLSAFDIFTLTSVKEGLPYVLLEAAHAGLPTVVSEVGGIPDVIGENGILVDPKDPDQIAGALRELIENKEKREQLGVALRRDVNERFSYQNMVDKTFTLYS